MKEKTILILIIILYSSITTPLIKQNIHNSLDISQKNIDIAIADDFWDYLTRFSINN